MKLVSDRSPSDELRILIEIWELIDIMLIDSRLERSSSTELHEKLLKWSAGNNEKISELELKAFQSAGWWKIFWNFFEKILDQFNCVEFWHLVAANVMCGEMNQAGELIEQHPDYSEQNRALSTVHRWISTRPLLAHFSVTGSNIKISIITSRIHFLLISYWCCE